MKSLVLLLCALPIVASAQWTEVIHDVGYDADYVPGVYSVLIEYTDEHCGEPVRPLTEVELEALTSDTAEYGPIDSTSFCDWGC